MNALARSLSPKEPLSCLPSPDFYIREFRRLPTIGTDRLILRKVRRSDAADLFAYARDPEVSRHVLWSPHESLFDSRLMICQLRRQYRRGEPATFGITLRETGRLIGTIGFMQLITEHRCAEIGYSLSRDYWNRGLMTEALIATIDYAFNVLRLKRVEALHETDNPASGRVMEKAGMQEEGVLRQRILNKGHFSDVKIWSVLDAEWPHHKEDKNVHL